MFKTKPSVQPSSTFGCRLLVSASQLRFTVLQLTMNVGFNRGQATATTRGIEAVGQS